MDRIPIALVAGLLGGAGGALAVRYLAPPAASGPEASGSTAERASLDDLARQVADVKRLLERPAAASLAGSPAPAPRAGGDFVPGAGPGGASVTPGSPELEALIRRTAEKAADDVLAKQAAALEAMKPAAKKRAPLAEVAREVGLSASQETEIREAYRDAIDKFLKAMSEPDGDPEAIRRELSDAKGNKGKGQALMVKYMPKIFGHLGDVMSIQAERDARVEKALGTPEASAKFKKYKVEEEDPFGMDGGGLSVGAEIK